MKKGEKLSDTLYFLEVKDLRNIPVVLGTSRSLRDAVKLASQYVVNMDNYSKVYREATALNGVFAGVYFARNQAGSPVSKPNSHLLVIIHSSKVQHSDEQDLMTKLDQAKYAHSSRLPGFTDAFPKTGSSS